MHYIKLNSLSVGYNNEIGQPFFDLLNIYKEWIHSYFFSVEESFYDKYKNLKFNFSEEIEKIKQCETYHIPANILFNSIKIDHKKTWEHIIDELINNINLTSVTILDLDIAKEIRCKYPELEIHLSVKYFDYKLKYLDSINENDFILELDSLKGLIDVINISGTYCLNDTKFLRRCRELGFKIKFIVDEGCIFNIHFNYSKFPEFKYFTCYEKNGCNNKCLDIIAKYPWMNFARTMLYKEQLQYIDYDILKISSRGKDFKQTEYSLKYWISENKTDIAAKIPIVSEKGYNLFLDLMKYKSTCKMICNECRMCEKYYNLLKNDALDHNFDLF